MSNLSQEEINALLAQLNAGGDDAVAGGHTTGELQPDQLELLAERLNNAFGAGAMALSALFGANVAMARPELSVEPVSIAIDRLAAEEIVAARAEFTQGLAGTLSVVFSRQQAQELAALLLAGSDEAQQGFGPIHQSALGEAVGQLFGAASTRLAEILGLPVSFAPPEVAADLDAVGLLRSAFLNVSELVLGHATFQVDGATAGNLRLLLSPSVAEALAPTASAPASPPPPQPVAAAPPPASAAPAAAPAPSAAMAPVAPAAHPPANASAAAGPKVVVQPAVFQDLGQPALSPEAHNIELLLDVPLQLTVELGRTKRQIRDVLSMTPGSVIELDRLAGEAVDVLANGKLIAKGEVVVIDENFGVRITDIVSPAERVRSL